MCLQYAVLTVCETLHVAFSIERDLSDYKCHFESLIQNNK